MNPKIAQCIMTELARNGDMEFLDVICNDYPSLISPKMLPFWQARCMKSKVDSDCGGAC